MFNIIEDLKRSAPQRRLKLLERMHEKNIEYFGRTNPELAEFLRSRKTGSFNVKITDKSIEVVDLKTNTPCHPPGELFQYMSDFAYWHHTAWIDKTTMMPVGRGEGEHGRLLWQFVGALYKALPELETRKQKGEISLPMMRDGRRYSGAVVFLGIMTGLHVMNYLNRTEVREIFLIEPDADRFALSAYFLDYSLIEKRFGRLLLHVGPELPQNPVDAFIGSSPITSNSWIRLLPAYNDGRFDDTVNRVTLRWRSLAEVFVPFHRELQNSQFGMRNLLDRKPMLDAGSPPELSKESTIAVVASGPSLENDIPWLKENRGKLILLAAISAVRVLKKHGIVPDFQCTLDTVLEDFELDRLQLDYDVPLLAYFKLDPEVLERFSEVYLLPETDKANPVKFLADFHYTHPTSGNLMAAFASWCKPSKLLFFGLDFGYRDVSRSHAAGTWHDDDEGRGHKAMETNREQIPVPANFPESDGQIYTQAYFSSARAGVEGAIVRLAPDSCSVFNFADGARIAGAAAMRSRDFPLSAYPARSEDIDALKSAFSTNPDQLWRAYPTSGQQLLDELAEDLMTTLRVEGEFDWPRVSKALDLAWTRASNENFARHREWRIEIFHKFVLDVLAEWYRALIFAENLDELEVLYEVGLAELRKVLDGLSWPEDLDLPGPAASPGADPAGNFARTAQF